MGWPGWSTAYPSPYLSLSSLALNWNLIQFFYLPHLLRPQLYFYSYSWMSPPAFACKLSPDSRSNRFQFPLHICCVREGGGGRSYESGRDMHEFMALVMNNMRRGLVDAEQIQCQWLIWLILCSFNVACKFSQIAYVLNYGIPYHAPPPFCLYPFFPLPASQPAQWAVQISACAGFPFKIIWPEVTSQQNCPTYLA